MVRLLIPLFFLCMCMCICAMQALEFIASSAAFSWKAPWPPHACLSPQALIMIPRKPGLKLSSWGWQACWQRRSIQTLEATSHPAFQSSFTSPHSPKSERLLATPEVTCRVWQLNACGICYCEVFTRVKCVNGFKEGLEKLVVNSSIGATSAQ